MVYSVECVYKGDNVVRCFSIAIAIFYYTYT